MKRYWEKVFPTTPRAMSLRRSPRGGATLPSFSRRKRSSRSEARVSRGPLKLPGVNSFSAILTTEKLNAQIRTARSMKRSVAPSREEISLFCRLTGTGVAGFDNGLDSSSWVELPRDHGPDRTAGLDDIVEDAVKHILVEYAQIPVGRDVFLKALQFQEE